MGGGAHHDAASPCLSRRSLTGAARRALAAVLLSLASALALVSPPAVAADPSREGLWGPVMDFGAAAVHMTLMRTGKVLVWRLGDEARVWDPATGDIKLTPFTGSNSNIECAGQVVLADGRVLTVGGQHIKTTATFDPLTMTWMRLPD